MDMEFYELMPRLFHDPDGAVRGSPASPRRSKRRRSATASLQAAYFILACRALGLDCGPMSGFDKEKVDAGLLRRHTWRSNFICNIGYWRPGRRSIRATRAWTSPRPAGSPKHFYSGFFMNRVSVAKSSCR